MYSRNAQGRTVPKLSTGRAVARGRASYIVHVRCCGRAGFGWPYPFTFLWCEDGSGIDAFQHLTPREGDALASMQFT